MNWKKSDIENLKLKTDLNTVKSKPSKILQSKSLVSGKISIEKESIKTVLWVFKREGLISDYFEELEFDEERKFRFDWAIPSLMIAIEYEGLFSEKSGHTTMLGYTKDCQKYNLATINGWKVLRYTALNYKNFEPDLKKLLKM